MIPLLEEQSIAIDTYNNRFFINSDRSLFFYTNRGEYQKKPAKYVVFGINEGLNLRTKDLKENIISIENMGKEGIIAVIERRGEIIYYKINRKRFEHNNKLISLV